MADVDRSQRGGRNFEVVTALDLRRPPVGPAAHPSFCHRAVPVAGATPALRPAPAGQPAPAGRPAPAGTARDAIEIFGRLLWAGTAAVVWTLQALMEVTGPVPPRRDDDRSRVDGGGDVSDERPLLRILHGSAGLPAGSPAMAVPPPRGRGHLRLIGAGTGNRGGAGVSSAGVFVSSGARIVDRGPSTGPAPA